MTTSPRAASPQAGIGAPVEDMFPRVISLLEAARSATVLCHVHPDADTIGSGLALAMVLDRRGGSGEVSFAVPEELPESMNELPGREMLVPAREVRSEVDLVVTVDAGSRGRLGALADRIDSADACLVIDHHRSNTRFGTVNLVDDGAESTTAVITRLFDAWDIEVDADVAHCLFAGLVTDTGSFRWVRPGSHLLAERLLATGIDGAAIARKLLDSHPFGWLPMLGKVLGSATLVPDGVGGLGLVYAVIEREDTAGLRSEEIESVIDIVRTTAEAEVAAVFKQQAGDEWTVSLRSKTVVDVSTVATVLGGGGHRNAAGFTAHGTMSDVVATLIDALS